MYADDTEIYREIKAKRRWNLLLKAVVSGGSINAFKNSLCRLSSIQECYKITIELLLKGNIIFLTRCKE